MAIGLLLATGIFMLFGRDGTGGDSVAQPEQVTISSDVQQVREDLSLPEGWQRQTFQNDLRAPSFVLRAKRDDPSARVVVTVLEGKLVKDFDIKTLSKPIIAAYRKKIVGFKLVKQEIAKVGGYDVVKIRYTEQGEPGAAVFENLHVVVPTPDHTYTLDFQTDARAYDKVSGDFEQIVKNITESAR
ncbi:MAG: LpqN/LpqT family lipoprotein [bacterium]|nr:LpqN/LpqT family lipoprotein [bacterium]MDZ4248338.1 LpqN/LpqT family lipoprotein [Patescibacteria group bacterium]